MYTLLVFCSIYFQNTQNLLLITVCLCIHVYVWIWKAQHIATEKKAPQFIKTGAVLSVTPSAPWAPQTALQPNLMINWQQRILKVLFGARQMFGHTHSRIPTAFAVIFLFLESNEQITCNLCCSRWGFVCCLIQQDIWSSKCHGLCECMFCLWWNPFWLTQNKISIHVDRSDPLQN